MDFIHKTNQKLIYLSIICQ